jgi:hypothetical protein
MAVTEPSQSTVTAGTAVHNLPSYSSGGRQQIGKKGEQWTKRSARLASANGAPPTTNLIPKLVQEKLVEGFVATVLRK